MTGEGLKGSVVVTEIFHSIQGESSWAGQPCIFIRLTGCPLRCRWCDTTYSFSGGKRTTIAAILEKIAGYPCRLVEVTGGEPLAQPGALTLMTALADAGYTVLLETAGSHPIDVVDPRVRRIVDLKAPGSDELASNHWANLNYLKAGDEVKIVLANREDYEWARQIVKEYDLPQRTTVLFSPVHGELEPEQLARWVLDDGLQVRFQLQLHKYIWSPEMRGV